MLFLRNVEIMQYWHVSLRRRACVAWKVNLVWADILNRKSIQSASVHYAISWQDMHTSSDGTCSGMAGIKQSATYVARSTRLVATRNKHEMSYSCKILHVVLISNQYGKCYLKQVGL